MDIKALYDEIQGKSLSNQLDKTNIDSLYNEMINTQDAAQTAADRTKASVVGKTEGTTVEDTVKGISKGIQDVINTGGLGLGFIEDKLGIPGGKERRERFQNRVTTENKEYEDTLGGSTGASIGRVGGQIAATAPLVPARVIQGIDAGMAALPTINAAGQRVVAPLVNRLSAAVNKGAVGGATFGAATSASNDESVGENALRGMTAGAVAGPAATAIGAVGSKIGKSLWAAKDITQVTSGTNLAPSAVKNIIARLNEAGISPQQAQQELAKLGPKATIADLDPALAAEASGLAQIGGTPTSLLKNRFQVRADTADTSAQQIMNAKLGGKPDLTTAKEQILEDAKNATSGDYKVAYNSGQAMDVSGVVKSIDDQLINAVGSKEALLKKIKAYLFRDGKDAQGNDIKVLKADIPALHEVRQALDDVIEKGQDKLSSSSLGKNTLRSLTGIRAGIDQELKNNPQMAAADAKFAEKMKAKEGLDTGYEAFKSNQIYLDFQRSYANATPETQDAIKNGMHAKIGDLMDAAQKGELSGVQRLFAKNSSNRAKFQLVFGQDADEVLDALSKEGSFRNTEREVVHGSQTALRQSVQTRYGGKPPVLNSPFAETLTGIVGDISMGMPALTAVNVAKRGGGNVLNRLTTYRTGNLTSGSADILSRSGAERDTALDILKRVQAVQSKSSQVSNKSILRLPTTAPAAIGEQVEKK